MKKLLLCLIGLLFTNVTCGQPVIDENVELIGIAYNLAKGKDVPDYFVPYQEHDLVKYIRHLADSLNNKDVDISTWELPSVAVHIGKVEPGSKSNDSWDDRSLLTKKMVAFFQQFHIDTNAKQFFKSYNDIIDNYKKQNIVPYEKWIKDFTGLTATEQYYPILSPQASNGAYMRVNFEGTRRNTYSIFVCNALNDPGIPRLMIHEIVHKYVNQLVDNHKEELRPQAERLLKNPVVWARVKETFYNNWEYLMYESIVRACSIKYIIDNKLFDTTLEREINQQEMAGFLWMRDLIIELDTYQSRRPEFKNLEQFMPAVIKVFEK